MSASATTNASATRSETIFRLQQALKLALSMVLFYWLALWMNWDLPKYGGLAIVIISLGTSGASIQKGVARISGTTVGVIVGFLILGLFNHDRWAAMLAFAIYIAAIGYFMQTSRYSYAWYVAGFVPLVVWGDNYPHFDQAFYFGTFRYLETTAGVLIYTMVDMLLWPRSAGEQLNQQVRELSTGMREQFQNYRRQLEGGTLPPEAAKLRTKLAGSLSKASSTLQSAYADTPTVNSQKRVWEAWSVNSRVLVDALELWQEGINDCRQLDTKQLIPRLGQTLDSLENRLERIVNLWKAKTSLTVDTEMDDSELTSPIDIDLDDSGAASLSHFERAAMLSFIEQLKILDRASRELLETIQALTSSRAAKEFRPASNVRDVYRPSRWDPGRLLQALFPPVAFIAAFIFWIYMQPPTGPKIPMFTGILSLVVLRTPMNPSKLLIVFVLAIFIVVAPIYWLVMPRLSTGIDLLGLIFICSFVFGYLGGRSPALKSGPLIMFVVMSGISNDQSYSFQGLVDGSIMIMLAGVILTIVYFCFNPLRQEQSLLLSLRRFFNGCAHVTSGLSLDASADRSHSGPVHKRRFQSMIRSAPVEIAKAAQHLDYKLHPDNSPEKVQALNDSVQSLTYRLQSLEFSNQRASQHDSKAPESLVSIGNQIRESVQHFFQRWATLGTGKPLDHRTDELRDISTQLAHEINSLMSDEDFARLSETEAVDLYTVLGNVRGLLASMTDTEKVISEIDWSKLSMSRF